MTEENNNVCCTEFYSGRFQEKLTCGRTNYFFYEHSPKYMKKYCHNYCVKFAQII